MTHSARKVIRFYESGIGIPCRKCRGHGYSGVGSILGWEMHHHAFLYDLYCDNPSLPIDGYVDKFLFRYGMTISNSTVERWFQAKGSFKGTMRVTSRYPSGRNSWSTTHILRDYLAFVLSIDDHYRLVFVYEKPMK